MDLNDLTPAELRVWEAFPTGAAVDFQGSAERTVRAVVLRALMLNGPRQDGEVPVLRVAGAHITGVLDVRYGAVETYVRLSRCQFDEVPLLYGCEFRQLNLSGSELPGLAAATLRVDGVLRLTDCRFTGPVALGGSQISGALFMDRAEFHTSDDSDEPALRLNHASIGEDLVAPGIRVHGRMVCNDASVDASVNLMDAMLENPGGTALDAQTLSVASDVHARRLTAVGRLDLRGARVTGRLDLAHSRLSNPGHTVLQASSSVIGELWLNEAEPLDGSVNFRQTQTDLLRVAPETLAGEVRLNGLSYTMLSPHVPAERWLPVLRRDVDGYVPHAYEQLTALYQRIGDDHAARLVQLAKQRRLRTTRAWYGRLWGYLQDVTVGYGFRPLRALAWLLSLLAVGTIAYGLHEPPALKASEHPDFSPVFFTLDLLLPVISFGQEGAFAPKGGYQALSYALVITGWLLATTVITGITRAVSRQ
ncbi:membrane-associated oxidoreductase [Streptomyces justiciae]|uniref:membrane-associated oxidoreductase n=1 Tax=Streptomyces justiciae TaxID=2780140 RepID=UPI002118DEB4|nr:membrane-associated oxidoreductase [Streptomyces justiciae]MCW8383063.1 membrane-associated oxidoreductase [Streptomyces justiciae]